MISAFQNWSKFENRMYFGKPGNPRLDYLYMKQPEGGITFFFDTNFLWYKYLVNILWEGNFF